MALSLSMSLAPVHPRAKGPQWLHPVSQPLNLQSSAALWWPREVALFALVHLLGITCYGVCILRKNIPWVVRGQVLGRGIGPKG